MTVSPVGGFGIYVHWPFCLAKCPYCDFNSHVRHQPVSQEHYAKALATELARYAQMVPGRTVDSVFFGGGTPSLMEPKTVETILNEVARLWHLPSTAEISMEANPTSVEATRFAGYRSAGVNRLSVGIQALDDKELKILGRQHSVSEAIRAVEIARKTFPRISFDLIYARPNQTLKVWEQELNRAIDLAADHLSMYQLTIESGTMFQRLYAAGKLEMLDPDLAADMFDLTQEVTAARGLPAYEVSNHAAPDAQCQHNLIYWRYGDYVGVGPGAHGRLTLEDGTKLATSTEKHPETWLGLVESQGHGSISEDILGHGEQGDELLLMGMRLHEGIDVPRYEQLSGRQFNPQRLLNLQENGMVEWVSNTRLRATQAGFPLLDAVIAELASD
ncbi:Oxygen-independent coproporphyrinogen-III oxidase 1 [Pseudovibrio sp. W64]|uniref:radical SAM family heme chaperone HemW n=1 Tax=unclassified Pseudovibrio TaxID=2627060 RepID=UPI0007AEBA28|nr:MULTISPECIES: radical SAM family heme chaperone HemW [unclassified Pseudovibrio]KZK84406.1 Oxygen-independent coproporphyrinogen-III oxidase 1 [Pseudovibrio sp. W64]KZK89220.1 Oxygen-independent coproporphyrinogen-III oxidase 1 [Pseudovibrio sp. Ad5]KZK95360.1 Oxygen-independent coproporphyrinogen-III oxidase 1 [Pseudovibrio sp. Ad46]